MRIAEAVFWKIMMMIVAPSRPRPTVNMPATPPVRKATFSAAGSEPALAAAAVRTLPRTARLMPMNPVSPDITQPAMNASVRNSPEAAKESPDEASSGFTPTRANASRSGLATSVAVANTMIASGMRITAIVLNWRLRYAMAPSWIASAISIMVGVPCSAASTPFMRKKPTTMARSAVTAEKISQNHSSNQV